MHLDGIIDLTPDLAKFAVFGSTGSHYTVTLKDEKHTCTCLDHRFRRHNCKHILAVCDGLGILQDPTQVRLSGGQAGRAVGLARGAGGSSAHVRELPWCLTAPWGLLPPPAAQWREAVEGRVDQLAAELRERRGQEAPRPSGKEEAVGLKFV